MLPIIPCSEGPQSFLSSRQVDWGLRHKAVDGWKGEVAISATTQHTHIQFDCLTQRHKNIPSFLFKKYTMLGVLPTFRNWHSLPGLFCTQTKRHNGKQDKRYRCFLFTPKDCLAKLCGSRLCNNSVSASQ